MDELKEKTRKLLWIMDELRAKCPWDKKQTHKSLARYLQEESFEVIETIYAGDPERLKEELGDLLFQIIFHSKIAEEKKEFDIRGVIDAISEKMISRHPHVFDSEAVPPADEKSLKDFWNKKKHAERKGRKPVSMKETAGLRGAELAQKALFIQNFAARKGFDWENPGQIIDKMEEELKELRAALKKGKRKEIKEEIGDIILTASNLCRFLLVDFEEAFGDALNKFAERFDKLREKTAETGRPMEDFSLKELEQLWQSIKE
jgi:tetrapyrrole methylase family protein / MazG family protein